MGIEAEDFLGNPHKPDLISEEEIYSDQDDEVWSPFTTESPLVVMEHEDTDDPDWQLNDNLDLLSTDDGDSYVFEEDDYETMSNLSDDSLPIEAPPPITYDMLDQLDDKLDDFSETLDPLPNTFPES